ncbi:Gfo/Idh/MocA family oxidoreductase [Catenulispora subtropica]|uniref:Gfo/Idh/MocA family oxidoreductase n=1 Tax=Catenulispora subtropica TaxID=450798 RepID=A0ABN2S5U7_9ACTN
MTVTLAIAGAGGRGRDYARHATASGARITAVAEPRAEARAAFAAEFGVPAENAFAGWEDLARAGRLADAVVIATQDAMHADPAVAFAGLGYHILLEKPMAPTEAASRRIAEAAERAGILLTVCHVLRYTAYTRALKDVLDSGRIGDIASIQHLESVGWWHQAHSYVRGNWATEAESSPMLLAKSCHDIDWLMHIMGRRPTRVSSFGSLLHFRPENKPALAAERCLDCAVESTCPYSARRIYLNFLATQPHAWPVTVLTDDHTETGVITALRDGPYGRCVYNGDNDVVDHQVVDLEFAGGATVSFTMSAFTRLEHRKTRIFGTRGMIDGDGVRIRVTDFLTDTDEVIDTGRGSASAGDHGGGDSALVAAFLEAVRTGDRSHVFTDAASSLASHRVVWAAEQARKSGTVVELDQLQPRPFNGSIK